MDPLKPKTVSIREAARLLCLTTDTIRNLIHDGRLEVVAVGVHVEVTLTSLDVEFSSRYPDWVRPGKENADAGIDAKTGGVDHASGIGRGDRTG